MNKDIPFCCVVEGLLDEVVLKTVFRYCQVGEPIVYGSRNGKGSIKANIRKYNEAGNQWPWLVLVDLDNATCAPGLIAAWKIKPANYFALRVAVREIEAWLLADKACIAKFLKIDEHFVEDNPEMLLDPKTALLELVRKSPRRDVREDMLPRQGSGRSEGPAYWSCLADFVQEYWDIAAAMRRSNSLAGCVKKINDIRSRYQDSHA